MQALITATKAALRGNTIIPIWDYEGVAPDSAYPRVGSVWPMSITPGTVGRSDSVELLCVTALWATTEAGLLEDLSTFTREILGLFGVNAPCPPELSEVSALTTLGEVVVGAPSYTAASSIGTITGVWASVRFTLSTRLR